jgi:aspartyl-tRNA synthetase
VFVDLRDASGLVQVVFNPKVSKCEVAGELRSEYVVKVTGEVVRRPSGTENPKLATGEIEVVARAAEILNTSKTPPFYINEETKVDEELRFKYRYLDLRRAGARDNIILRHRVIKFMRDFLDAKGFVEIETPILINSTPEGARDYLVPSRVQPGKFYALPQSPQQLKQLLMVAGFEKYYQIAKCFRDEDLRADRQPEFTQLDIEMSFVEESDILDLVEELFTSLVEAVKPEMRVIKPFPCLSYAESMERYGTDKPDMRFGLELRDVSDIVTHSDFSVFRSAVLGGGKVKGICAPGFAHYSRHQLEELTQLVKGCGGGGLVALPLDEGESMGASSRASKFLTPGEVKGMADRLGARRGDVLLLVAGESMVVNGALRQLRVEMGHRLGLADPNLLAFVFVVDYPMLEWDTGEKRWIPAHHPFTAPKDEDIPLLDTAPERARSKHYDIVCNGCELSSGSIRIHTRWLQEKMFRLLGYDQREMEERFGHLLEALEYGVPPHGGIAPGIDRIVMLLAGEQNIKEVIPFPKSKSAVDLLTGAPSPVSEEQLRELHLKLSDE